MRNGKRVLADELAAAGRERDAARAEGVENAARYKQEIAKLAEERDAAVAQRNALLTSNGAGRALEAAEAELKETRRKLSKAEEELRSINRHNGTMTSYQQQCDALAAERDAAVAERDKALKDLNDIRSERDTAAQSASMRAHMIKEARTNLGARDGETWAACIMRVVHERELASAELRELKDKLDVLVNGEPPF